MTEPAAPSLRLACERLAVGLHELATTAEDCFSATAALESGADIPRLSAALDALQERVTEVQRAIQAYQGLTHAAEAGWRQRQRLQN